jgi:Tfp pilus assembly protein PilV
MKAMTWFKKRNSKEGQRGDTIVEVLFAVVILAMIFTTAYGITDYGLETEQTSVERTSLSDYLQSQAETLHTLRDNDQTNTTAEAIWNTILSQYVETTTPNYSSCNPTVSGKDFYINTSGATLSLQPGMVTNSSIGLKYWVEAYQPNTDDNYIDFQIRGCWLPGGETPLQTSVIVERLITP